MHPPVCCLVLICKIPATAFCICNAARMGVCLSNRRGIHESPADFAVILRNGQDRFLRTKCIFRVGRGQAPAVFAPSERGLSNAKHLTGGEIFSFLSLRLLPAAKATSLIRGRNNGSSRTPTPTHEIECIHPHKPQFVILNAVKNLKNKVP